MGNVDHVKNKFTSTLQLLFILLAPATLEWAWVRVKCQKIR